MTFSTDEGQRQLYVCASPVLVLRESCVGRPGKYIHYCLLHDAPRRMPLLVATASSSWPRSSQCFIGRWLSFVVLASTPTIGAGTSPPPASKQPRQSIQRTVLALLAVMPANDHGASAHGRIPTKACKTRSFNRFLESGGVDTLASLTVRPSLLRPC